MSVWVINLHARWVCLKIGEPQHVVSFAGYQLKKESEPQPGDSIGSLRGAHAHWLCYGTPPEREMGLVEVLNECLKLRVASFWFPFWFPPGRRVPSKNDKPKCAF